MCDWGGGPNEMTGYLRVVEEPQLVLRENSTDAPAAADTGWAWSTDDDDKDFIYKVSTDHYPQLAPGWYEPYPNDQTHRWELKRKTVPTDQLVRLVSSTTQRLLDSITKFWNAADRYAEMGALHRRGILLHGAPGIGKTAAIHEVCETLITKHHGVVIVVAHPWLPGVAQVLQMFREVEPTRPVVLLIEDVERYLDEHEEALLSLLSGQGQMNHALTLATTNYLEKLPARMVNRPSRFDEVVELEALTLLQRTEFIQKMSGSGARGLCHTLAQQSEGFTAAHLKELVVSVFALGERSDVVLARLRALIDRERKAGKGGEGEDGGGGGDVTAASSPSGSLLSLNDNEEYLVRKV